VDSEHKILFVDDASMFRELGALFLARSGRVITACDGIEALEIMRREHPDILVSDLSMPAMDGAELCRQVKADPDLRDTPVILVTSGTSARQRASAVYAGADDVIAKPMDRISFIQVVNRFLRFPGFRGLARVPMETSVRMNAAGSDAVGSARNLSRGGLFVEAECAAPIESEMNLQFRLPGAPEPINSTAKVVWRSESSDPGPTGMGLQFLALDRRCVRSIEEFIYENDTRTNERTGSASVAARA